MSVNKWSRIDHGKTAHWWLGGEGTACGRDFKVDIRLAYDEDPRCRQCVAVLTNSPAAAPGDSPAPVDAPPGPSRGAGLSSL